MNARQGTLKDYEIICEIGKGATGIVYLVKSAKTKHEYACKRLNRKEMEEKWSLISLEEELRIHQNCKHPNIVQVLEIIYDEDFISIIMEYCPKGDLLSAIQSKIVNPLFAFKIISQICQGISYLHSRNIAHRDLKLENILLDENYNAKICDFGSTIAQNFSGRTMFSGTYEFMPPEIREDKISDYRKGDIWALGIIIYSILMESYPFDLKLNQKDLIEKMIKNNLPLLPPKFRRITERCLCIDPYKRANIDEILLMCEVKNSERVKSRRCTSLRIESKYEDRFLKKTIGKKTFASFRY